MQTMFIFHFSSSDSQGSFLKILMKTLASFFEKIAKLVKFILEKNKICWNIPIFLSTKFVGKSNDDYNNLKRSEDKCKLGQ
jgi:hypothetical protein